MPNGGDLARAGTGEDLLVAEIDLSAIARARAYQETGVDAPSDARPPLRAALIPV